MSSQQEVCNKFNASYSPCSTGDKLGIAIETIGQLPINGLRHEAENGTCGWYIWCGKKWSDDKDFFKPLHVSNVGEYLPEIEKYLALPSGFRFLIAGEHEEV